MRNTSIDIKSVEDRHGDRIFRLIKSSNPLIYKINFNNKEKAYPFICEEYNAEFLMEILGINSIDLNEPILDIGCGSRGSLVNYLSSIGVETYGIDRISLNPKVIEVDWFNFDYGKNIWGTIISNLSFTSYFLHYHLNNDDTVNDYAKTFIIILNSLKKIGEIYIYYILVIFRKFII